MEGGGGGEVGREGGGGGKEGRVEESRDQYRIFLLGRGNRMHLLFLLGM